MKDRFMLTASVLLTPPIRVEVPSRNGVLSRVIDVTHGSNGLRWNLWNPNHCWLEWHTMPKQK